MSSGTEPRRQRAQKAQIRMQRCWRLVKTAYADHAFDGEGAFRFGGRWNSRGQRMVYVSGSLSLALLEILVHLDPADALPALSAIPVGLPDSFTATKSFSRLEDLNGSLPWALGQTRAWGDAWLAAQRSVALQVPSSIVPIEHNFLLNPEHSDFAKLQIGEPEIFTLDDRLAPDPPKPAGH